MLAVLGLGFLQLWRVGATLQFGAWASHDGGSSCRVQARGHTSSVVVAPQLQVTGSVVGTHGLSCSTAHESFLDQGLSLCLPHCQADPLPLSHQESPAAATESLQPCPTLCGPTDGSAPGSSVHRIFQAEYWSGVPLPSPKTLLLVLYSFY